MCWSPWGRDVLLISVILGCFFPQSMPGESRWSGTFWNKTKWISLMQGSAIIFCRCHTTDYVWICMSTTRDGEQTLLYFCRARLDDAECRNMAQFNTNVPSFYRVEENRWGWTGWLEDFIRKPNMAMLIENMLAPQKHTESCWTMLNHDKFIYYNMLIYILGLSWIISGCISLGWFILAWSPKPQDRWWPFDFSISKPPGVLCT